MAQKQVLRWLDGRGWLVLSGGHAEGSEIRAQALSLVAADGGVAYVSFGGGTAAGEQALADMDDLGAPPGYIVDVLTEDDQTISARLAEAGMIVLESGPNLADVRSALMGAASAGMQAAFKNGAIILAEGWSGAAFGAWAALESGSVPSLAWLENSAIFPTVTSITQSESARALLQAQPAAIVIGLGVGSALALGPDGEVETWGKRQVTIALGRDYQT
jgi:hypothetical protein